MKNRNTQLTAVLFVVALALAPIVQAGPRPDGGPTRPPPNEAPSPDGGPTRPPPNEAPVPDGGPAHQSSTVRANASSEAPYLTVAQPTSHLLRALMRAARQSLKVRTSR